jgi:hypothetical protein
MKSAYRLQREREAWPSESKIKMVIANELSSYIELID